MRKVLFLFISLCFLIMFYACSSIDGDAKDAANLNKKSIGYIKENKLEKASDAYEQSQEIIARYKDTEQFDEFYTAYSNYMSEISQ